jgi:hypothetical protein
MSTVLVPINSILDLILINNYMKTIYLYLKTHNITGLKYLGKTTRNPMIYKGSGIHWKRHLAKHGDDVSTEILFETTDATELREVAMQFSNLWDVENNAEFANLRPESGDGGDTSACPGYKEGMAHRDLSGSKNPMFGRSAVTENRLKWYNNGVDNVYVTEGTAPNGFTEGRIIDYKTPHSEETKRKIGLANAKKCISPKGEVFDSAVIAGRAYGVTSAAILGLIKRGVSGWRHL